MALSTHRIGTLLFALLAWVALSAALPRPARADSPFDGKWKQGPLREEYSVQKWIAACGQPPISGSSGGGEIVTIHAEGDDLAIVGAGRVFRTNQCYDQMPTLSRDSHSRDASGRSWRTRCTTPAEDPRHAALNTLVSAPTDTHIDLVETGRYESTLEGGHCIADVKRSRSFDSVSADVPAAVPPATATAPPATAKPTPPAPDPSRCASPGDPVRLEVRPSRKLLRAGDSFAFHSAVVDANGCSTHTAMTWSSDSAATSTGSSIDASGKVTVPADATEGTFTVVATAAGKSATVTVEVVAAARYDEFLASSGLNDAGESEAPSVALIATSSIGGGDAKGEDGSRRRRMAFVAIVVSMAVALLIVGIIGSRRAGRQKALAREASDRHAERMRDAEERRKARTEQHAAAVRAHQESIARAADLAAAGGTRLICPACRREYSAGSVFCPNDANRLVPVNGHEEPLGGAPGGICPTCKRGFDPGVKTCPHDGDELVPYALHASREPPLVPTAVARGKICPTCGDRFEGNAAFCGKDGTALVLLN